jgi:hypothetical protein
MFSACLLDFLEEPAPLLNNFSVTQWRRTEEQSVLPTDVLLMHQTEILFLNFLVLPLFYPPPVHVAVAIA